ncbi:MAG: hypothetical protein ACWA41_11355 [Putridiphycobacter sp.]
MSTNNVPIRYHVFWSNVYIAVGFGCALVFAVGGYLLKDIEVFLYIIITIFPILVGFNMRKSNYAIVSQSEIIIYGLFGQIRKQYQLEKNQKFILKSNKIYIQDASKLKKVKMNNWFVNRYDWQRAMELFISDDFEKIAKHLVSD